MKAICVAFMAISRLKLEKMLKVRAHFQARAESHRHTLSDLRFNHSFVTDNFPADVLLQSSPVSRILPDTSSWYSARHQTSIYGKESK